MGVRSFVVLRRGCIVSCLCALLACDLVGDAPGDSTPSAPEAAPDTPAEAVDAPADVEPEPTEPKPDLGGSPTDALGSAVAGIIERERTPTPTLRGADLELVEQIEITRLEGGWTQTTSSGSPRPEGAVFALELDVEVGEEIGINQARLVAKATCAVDDEQRMSSADVNSATPTHWGGAAAVTGDPGKHEGALATLFLQQDIVGHEPCQVEFRLVSPLSDKPLRVDGVWCYQDGAMKEGLCEGLLPPPETDGVRVRDWKIDRTRRNIKLTVDAGERIWLDRTLVIRSSCDDGGERVPRTQLTWGPQWGLLDPGDSVRVQAQHWNGWFASAGPCELTAELWQRNDRGQWSSPKEVGVACIRKFLPEDGHCPAGTPSSGGSGPVTLRKFEATIVKDPYDRRTKMMEADVELAAHENIDGRYQLELRGSCGKGRSAVPLWLGGATDVDPAMLRSGEVMKAQYRTYMGRRRANKCTIEAKLTPTDPAGSPVELGKYCVDEKSSKPC